MKTTHKNEWIFWLLLTAPFIYLTIVWNSVPETVPSHWNIKGEVDAWSSKTFLIILSGMNILLYLILLVIPKIDPRARNYNYFEGAYKKIKTTLLIFMTSIIFLIIFSVSGKLDLSGKWILISVFLLFAVLGNYMRSIRPNFFIGIRTPWTLDNDEVWRRTHEIGGRIFFYSGIAGILLTLLIPEQTLLYFVIPLFIATALYPVIYSFILFKKLKKEDPPA